VFGGLKHKHKPGQQAALRRPTQTDIRGQLLFGHPSVFPQLPGHAFKPNGAYPRNSRFKRMGSSPDIRCCSQRFRFSNQRESLPLSKRAHSTSKHIMMQSPIRKHQIRGRKLLSNGHAQRSSQAFPASCSDNTHHRENHHLRIIFPTFPGDKLQKSSLSEPPGNSPFPIYHAVPLLAGTIPAAY